MILYYWELNFEMRALWVLIFLFGSNETAWGQQKLIDSLQKALLAYPKRDTSHAKALNGLAAAYYVVNADSAISIGTRNRLLCKRLAYPEGEVKFAYDIWGDTVNTAARMESSSEPNRLNISETTYGLVKDAFVCISRGKVQAKGKGEIEMFFVNGKIKNI